MDDFCISEKGGVHLSKGLLHDKDVTVQGHTVTSKKKNDVGGLQESGYGTDATGAPIFWELYLSFDDGEHYNLRIIPLNGGKKQTHKVYINKIRAIEHGVVYGDNSLDFFGKPLKMNLTTRKKVKIDLPLSRDPFVFAVPFCNKLYLGCHSGLKLSSDDGKLTDAFSANKQKPYCAVAKGDLLYVGTLQGKILVLKQEGADGKLAIVNNNLLAKTPAMTGKRIRDLCLYEDRLFVAKEDGKIFTVNLSNNEVKLLEHLSSWTYGKQDIEGMIFNKTALYVHTDKALHVLYFASRVPKHILEVFNNLQRNHPIRPIGNYIRAVNKSIDRSLTMFLTAGQAGCC